MLTAEFHAIFGNPKMPPRKELPPPDTGIPVLDFNDFYLNLAKFMAAFIEGDRDKTISLWLRVRPLSDRETSTKESRLLSYNAINFGRFISYGKDASECHYKYDVILNESAT